jgi:hypothetical protein
LDFPQKKALRCLFIMPARECFRAGFFCDRPGLASGFDDRGHAMSAKDSHAQKSFHRWSGAAGILSAAVVLLTCSMFGDAPQAGADGAGADDSRQESWSDPYPPMPSANDPAFVGSKWRVGSTVDGQPLEYLAEVPAGDTASMPLIVVAEADNDGRYMSKQLYSSAIVVYIGPTAPSDAGDAHNAWLIPKPDSPSGPGCSPTCPFWMSVPAQAIRDVLLDLARHVRFAHGRAQMFAHNYSRYAIYRALDPVLQPYFAGVAHAVYAEWQQASCPDAPKPGSAAPRIFFSWGKCDQSFCPTMECMKTLQSHGYAIDPASGGDATPESCPCPASGRRPHLLGAGAQTREATYDWLLSNAREQAETAKGLSVLAK